LGIITPTDFHIFQRGCSTTNQLMTLLSALKLGEEVTGWGPLVTFGWTLVYTQENYFDMSINVQINQLFIVN
jgi:hypothetical protein